MLHRLCGPPSIPLSFTLASILPRRCTYRVSYGTGASIAPTPSAHRLRRGLPGYLILFAPHAFAPQRQFLSRSSPSPPVFFLISKISPLHQEFQLPLQNSSLTVPSAILRLGRSLSRQACNTAYTPFTPSDSEQRLPHTCYRGCWHVIGRGLFLD